ncbi:putative methyltransferase [Rodentibacter pneumotropicus]|uniref:Putative methyltransferase n=1 Tax=Rodentibacter pneumotropicus TaxID=758 RepID=A0A448MKY6_9PAST|nr:putative methyltransferase [Rodentibacter pneumotropicus]
MLSHRIVLLGRIIYALLNLGEPIQESSMKNKSSVYDTENFFELYQKLRANPISLNEIVEKPTMLSLLPELQGKNYLILVAVQAGICSFI